MLIQDGKCQESENSKEKTHVPYKEMLSDWSVWGILLAVIICKFNKYNF